MLTLDDYITEVENGFRFTFEPLIFPETHDNIVSWKPDGNLDSFDMIGISLGEEDVQFAHDDSLQAIQEFVDQYLKKVNVKVTIPPNALSVSCAMPNFTIGSTCQDFEPTYPSFTSYPTYQMLTGQCQATFMNEHGVQYLAGICYYLQPKDTSLLTYKVDIKEICEAIDVSEQYPLGNRWENLKFQKIRSYGRDCGGRRVKVYLEEGKEPVHQVYNHRTEQVEYEECEECREEAKVYKFGDASRLSGIATVTQAEEESDSATVI